MTNAETSLAAHRSIVNRKSVDKADIIDRVRMAGYYGITCEELELKTLMSHQTCSARISELLKGGFLKDSGSRRRTTSGRTARVYVWGGGNEGAGKHESA